MRTWPRTTDPWWQRRACALIFAVAVGMVQAPAEAQRASGSPHRLGTVPAEYLGGQEPPVRFEVNSTRDGPDVTPGDGVCDTGERGYEKDTEKFHACPLERECTLRAALMEAMRVPDPAVQAPGLQGSPAGDPATRSPEVIPVVSFRIPVCDHAHRESRATFPIRPGTALPPVTRPIVLDGYTQPGASEASFLPNIELDGRKRPWPGLVLATWRATVRGLIIGAFSGSGLLIEGRGANRVTGNWVGLDAEGRQPHPNAVGIRLRGSTANFLKGNVISGNAVAGVLLEGPGATQNRVIDNFVGTTSDGNCIRVERFDAAAGLTFVGDCDPARSAGNAVGVLVTGGRNNVIGPRNVISGNKGSGVVMLGAGTSGNRVSGNVIGLRANGHTPIPNGEAGVELRGAPGNLIGGTEPREMNVVSGNTTHGVVVRGPEARANRVRGNRIGTDAAGLSARGNGRNGIVLADAPDNEVGGIEPGAGNLISGHWTCGGGGCIGGAGVSLTGQGATGNRVQGNRIGTEREGRMALPNASGVFIGGPGNLVGGSDARARNVISWNGAMGAANVEVAGPDARGNRVEGNFIGLAASGTRSQLQPGESGIAIRAKAEDNVIGGVASGAGNTISVDGVAVMIEDSHRNRVQGNRIGGAPSGDGPAPSGPMDWGIYITEGSSHTLVAGNRISGARVGVALLGDYPDPARGPLTGTRIQGNRIDAGAGATPSTGDGHVYMDVGIEIEGIAPDTVIGGVARDLWNVIGGGRKQGILVSHSPGGITILGNRIGTDATGTVALPNGVGIELRDSSGIRIGSAQGGGNVIASSRGAGILIHPGEPEIFVGGNPVAPVARDHRIEGNVIGRPDGATGVPGNRDGVVIVDGSGNTVGGPGPAGNTIAGNLEDGVRIRFGRSNRITGNRIQDNGRAGIARQGGNNTQGVVPPRLREVRGRAIVEAEFDVEPFDPLRLEFFTSPHCGDGATLLGVLDVTPREHRRIRFQAPRPVEAGQFVTATATDPDGNTTELSNCLEVR
jgi:parallel beta-helix repeat protein